MHPALSFLKLTKSIEPTAAEILQANRHAHSIKRRLETSFKLKKFVLIGSHSRLTAIKNYSDLDIMAVLSREEAKWGGGYVASSTLLNNIRNDLTERYSQTQISKDQQAVVVEFAAGEFSVDIVPAIFGGFYRNYPIYLIPDGAGNWIETSPESHNRLIISADKKSGGKLKKTAKIIKFWRECRSPRIPISSFHIELLLASYATCVGPKSYAKCLTDAFRLLVERECRALRDPLGISGNVSAVKTEVQRNSVLSAVSYADDHAQRANMAMNLKNIDEASHQWKIIFNRKFPS